MTMTMTMYDDDDDEGERTRTGRRDEKKRKHTHIHGGRVVSSEWATGFVGPRGGVYELWMNEWMNTTCASDHPLPRTPFSLFVSSLYRILHPRLVPRWPRTQFSNRGACSFPHHTPTLRKHYANIYLLFLFPSFLKKPSIETLLFDSSDNFEIIIFHELRKRIYIYSII